MISKEKKAEIIAAYGRKPGDTGSPEVQIAILTERIAGKRRALLEYLKKNDIEGYRNLIARLGIRK